ncbi:MAG: asparagine synthetase B, partial [Planctomycetota bacterium]|nr:asparagine synthetase B [Planctomycetota bacterium]
MCGIVGIVGKNKIEESLIRRMCAALAHRGPDDEGVLVLQPRQPANGSGSSPRAEMPPVGPSLHATHARDSSCSGASVVRYNIALGHRRLSIIDLSPAAHQPMTSVDGSCHIVYNGEIYNFQELRSELEKLGHSFRSTGDTEVL